MSEGCAADGDYENVASGGGSNGERAIMKAQSATSDARLKLNIINPNLNKLMDFFAGHSSTTNKISQHGDAQGRRLNNRSMRLTRE